MAPAVPNNYNLCIRPDLASFEFQGDVEILFTASESVQEIELNALDLSFRRCEVYSGDGGRICDCVVDTENELVRIRLPAAVSGDFRLKIGYSGIINDNLAGFYRSGYLRGNEKRPMAITQFEESSARMAFPCFDHPRYKATFDVAMVVDADLTAISNGDIASEAPEGDGNKRVVFETTPKMSTYLLFFGVGDFDWVQDEKDRRVRAAAVPGSTEGLGMGLEFGRNSLEFCEQYFQIPYPMSKLDLIAVPDFAFGAMENWGAVVFRENLLLYNPEKTSQAGKERICEVIAHEIVHQWFGNLVSPEDWQYLWLNESFATFFANRILDHYRPEWHVWDQFLYTETSVALVRDALWETIPIEIPGGDTHVVINAATAPIIYNKGGGILNQMKGYIGEESFQKGLVKFLSNHAYECARSHHMWEAYAEATDKPVSRMMERWVSQPGFPVVTVRKNGTELYLSQERFTYLPPENEASASSSLWPVPLGIQTFTEDGRSMQFDILMDKKEVLLHVGTDVTSLKINSGQTGFYRVHYATAEMLDSLGDRVADRTLPAADRWGLQEDLFSMVRGGRVSADSYLAFLSYYADEDDFLPVISIAGNLHLLYLVATGELRERTAEAGKKLLEAVLGKIGYEPKEGEGNTTSMLRDAILFRALMFGSDMVCDWGEEAFDRLLGGDAVHPDIQRSVLQIGAWRMPGKAVEWFKGQLDASGSEHERMNILAAMGCLSDETVMREALAFTLDHVPQRNRHLPIVSCAGNPRAVQYMWEWFEANIDQLETFHPLLFERVIDSLVSVAGMGRAGAVRGFFKSYLSRKSAGAATIRIAMEFLAVNERLRGGRSPKGE
jgi:tricorn protease interacting factor F2/3